MSFPFRKGFALSSEIENVGQPAERADRPGTGQGDVRARHFMLQVPVKAGAPESQGLQVFPYGQGVTPDGGVLADVSVWQHHFQIESQGVVLPVHELESPEQSACGTISVGGTERTFDPLMVEENRGHEVPVQGILHGSIDELALAGVRRVHACFQIGVNAQQLDEKIGLHSQ